MEKFKALVVSNDSDGKFNSEVGEKTFQDLPEGEVLVRVFYSSLNYKDALSASGHKGITARFPHTPGIDAAGVVESSKDSRFSVGEEVIVTSYDLGMNTSGGFGQYIRVPGDWVLRLPTGLSLRDSMILGTAGLTAAIALDLLLEHGLKPENGAILVTGASGGVGSLGVALLNHCGFEVTALTGKAKARDFLEGLGATGIIDRKDFMELKDRPLMKASFQGVIDTVGGELLSRAIRSTESYGCIACCGLVLSDQIQTSLMPFLLRGVALVGVESGHYPMQERERIWSKLAGEWKIKALAKVSREVELEDLPEEISKILEGGQIGRVLVRVD